MLLTKDQQKHITQCLSKAASEIREKQNSERDAFSKKKEGVSEQVSSWERGIHHGMQAAYETSYHITKSAADESYSAEYNGADEAIEQVCLQMEGQATFLEDKGMSSQAELTRKFVKDIRLILHVSKRS